MPTITAFRDSPDQGQGMARDMRVRWALEETGQRYDVELLTFDQLRQTRYLAQQPFGQIPVFRDGDIALFESGAIVLHVAQQWPGLLPDDAAARARALSWLFAALNTIEPPIVEREQVEYTEADRPWFAERIPLLDARVRRRLEPLAARLAAREWLDGGFSVADLVMVTVLRRAEGTGVLEGLPALPAYIARGQARPAYQRAFAAQAAVFEAAQATRRG